MDFTPTERSLELTGRLLDFMREFVYPAEELYTRQRRPGDPHRLPPVVTELQHEARARGLWNLFLAQARLGPGRVHHCMRALGMAERALALMVRRASERAPFGRPLAEQGPVGTWIAESRLEIDQARLLVLRAAWLMDTAGNRGARTEIAGIKVVAARTAARVIDRAIQVFGAAGLSPDTPLALFYAMARQLRIVDGPDEVHLRSIARHELSAQASPPATAAEIRGETLMAPAN